MPEWKLCGPLVLLLVLGCARPSSEAYVRALEGMAELTERHREDCARMGEALTDFFENEGAAIRDYQAYSGRLSEEERFALEGPALRPRVQRAMKQLIPGHRRCLKHEAVRRAFERL